MLAGENSILKKTTDAKTKTEEASTKEQIQLQILGSFDRGASLNLTELKKNLQSIGATVDGNDFPVTATFNGTNYTINEDGSIGEREWTIAWVYNNSNWSNPYFKNASLKNNFDFSYEDGEYSTYIDTTYDLSSENDITGQFVVKLYSDGELEITGSGDLPEYLTPWFGCCHWVYESNLGSENDYCGMESSQLDDYLKNNITSIRIAEGITGIPDDAFSRNSSDGSFATFYSDIG